VNENFDTLLYEAGLTAQGCWDELGTYEQDAIIKFGELVARRSALIAGLAEFENRRGAGAQILDHFGIE
jgi:hypothetical protein